MPARPIRLLLAVLLVTALLAPLAAQAQQLHLSAVEVQATAAGDAVDATFKVSVTNAGDAAAANVWVVFQDGLEVMVGDVAPGASATSQTVARTLTEVVTAHQPVPVTLKYQRDGEPVEQAATLIVTVR